MAWAMLILLQDKAEHDGMQHELLQRKGFSNKASKFLHCLWTVKVIVTYLTWDAKNDKSIGIFAAVKILFQNDLRKNIFFVSFILLNNFFCELWFYRVL